MDNIDLGLIVGEIAIDGLRVGAASDFDSEAPLDPEAALLRLDGLNLEFEWLALARHRVHVRVVQLDGLGVRLTQRPDGSFDLPAPAEPPSDGIAADEPAAIPAGETGPSTADDADAAPAEPDEGWAVAIDRLELTALNLALFSAARQEQVARFSASQLGFDALSIEAEGIGLGDISLEQPDLDVDRDWLLAQGGNAPADEEPDEPAGEPPKLRLKHFELNSGGFQIRTPQGPLEAAIRVEVDDAGTAPGHVFPLNVELHLGEGQISLDGQLGLFPLVYQGRLQWTALQVPPFLLISNPEIVPWLASCNAAGDLQVSFRAVDGAEPAGLTTHGVASVSDLSFKDPETGELALEWKRVELELREANYPLDPSRSRRFDISRASLQAPQVVFTNPPDSLDRLLQLFAGGAPDSGSTVEPADAGETAEAEPGEVVAEAGAPDSDEAQSPATVIVAETVEMSAGQLLFVDRSVSPTHQTRIQDLRIQLTGLTTEPLAADRIDVRGRIQRSGTFRLQGDLPEGGGNLRLTVRGLDLVSYDAFARSAGWHVRSGDTSLDSTIRVKGERYRTRNELTLHDLRVDSNDPGAFTATFGISLDMALALLRDRSGDIVLSVPMTFDSEGLEVGLGGVVRSAVKSAIVGALSAPFRLVGALLPKGGGPPSFDPIPMAAGSAELGSGASERIDPFAKLLESRPELRLAVRGQTAPEDTAPLALRILEENATSGGPLPEVEGGGFFARRRVVAALRERAAGEAGPLEPDDEALLDRYVAAQEVPTERALALALARAETVRDALAAAGVPPEAMDVEAPAEAETAGVAIDLQLRPETAEGGN